MADNPPALCNGSAPADPAAARFPLQRVLALLHRAYPDRLVHEVADTPFKLLVYGILSQRNRESATLPVCERLFAEAATPETLQRLPVDHLVTLLHPLQFPVRKAELLHAMSMQLLTVFAGQVPNTLAALQTLPGIGPPHRRAGAGSGGRGAPPRDDRLRRRFPIDASVPRAASAWRFRG